MAIAKVILNGVTQMDVTQDTVTVDKLLSGYTATKNDGTKITGTATGGDGGSISVLDNLVVSDDAISVKFDIPQSWGESYNFLIIEISGVYDVAEWLYCDYDTTSPTNYIAGNAKTHWTMLPIRYNSITGMWETKIANSASVAQVRNRVDLPSYLYLKSYKNQASFKGTKITVYGGNL